MQEEIVEKKFPENVRTRPGMYIGGTEDPNVCVREIIDNSVDQIIRTDNEVIYYDSVDEGTGYLISDCGAGIPTHLDVENGITKCDLAMSKLHAGSKFSKDTVQIGMNGVGASVTNALSTKFVVVTKYIVYPDKEYLFDPIPNGYYYIEYNRGLKVDEGVALLEDLYKLYPELQKHPEMTTYTLFYPDPDIFDRVTCSINESNFGYLKIAMDKVYNKEVKIYINGELFEPNFEPYKFELPFTFESSSEKNPVIHSYFTFGFSEDLNSSGSSLSVNTLKCDANSFKAINHAISYALHNLYGIPYKYAGYGLHSFSLVLANEVGFDSQTKTRVTLIEGAQGEYYSSLVQKVCDLLESRYQEIHDHVERIRDLVRQFEILSDKQYIESKLVTAETHGKRYLASLPTKLSDALHPDRESCCLFVVEGDSAGGNMKQARDIMHHAILPLRGKPMNTTSISIEDLLENEEMYSLIVAIGQGLDGFETDQVRYGKIILLADADPDGLNINCLVLGTIAAHLRFLIDRGMVYIAQCPLFKQNEEYFTKFEDVDPNKPYIRYKGLGELDAIDLKKSVIDTIDTDSDVYLQVTNEKLQEALSILRTSHGKKQLLINNGVLRK